MTVSAAHMRATKKYREKTYDTIGFDVPKGKREEFKLKAAKLGLSLAKFLFVAAESYAHGGKLPATPPKPESISAADKRLIDEFNQLPVEAQKHLMKFLKSINDNTPH